MNIQWARTGASDRPPQPATAAREPGDPAWVSATIEKLYRSDGPVADLRKVWPQRCGGAFEILNILYVPNRSFQIIGRFAERATAGGDTVVALDFATVDDSYTHYAEALRKALVRERIAHLPAWEAVARLFPEDHGLPNLAAMLDLPAVAARLDCELDIDARWKLLSYQPGKRATLRYRLVPGQPSHVGKLQTGDSAIICHRRLQQLWQHPQRRFRMARPVAACALTGARWETFMAGTGLQQAWASAQPEPLLAAVMRALANLHGLALNDLPALQPETVLERIRRKLVRRLEVTVPDQALRAQELCRQLQARLPEPEPPVTLHGDFHLANLLLDGDNPVLLDLDDMRAGDPCYDLALFASRLLLVSLHRGDRTRQTLQLAARLPEIYRQQGGQPIDSGRYAWYMAALLLGRQVKSCIRDDAPDRAALVETLIDWAFDALHHGRFGGGED